MKQLVDCVLNRFFQHRFEQRLLNLLKQDNVLFPYFLQKKKGKKQISQQYCSSVSVGLGSSTCALDIRRRLRTRSIVPRTMASRACLLLAITAVAGARDCIELTLPDKNILTDTLLNNTILKVKAQNTSDLPRVNVVRLWDEFPKVVVPRNGTSEQCRRESQHFLDSLDRLELWALKSNFLFIACSFDGNFDLSCVSHFHVRKLGIDHIFIYA